MSTKSKITQKAIEVFNGQGFGNTTLLDIADALKISRGNLAYHYKDKESILYAIGQDLKNDIYFERGKRKNYPAFANLNIDLKAYYKLQRKYKFIFENNTVLKHQAIQIIMNNWAQDTIRDNLDSFAFAIQMGNMKPEPYAGMYYHLAVSTWILTYYWLSQNEVRGNKSEEDAQKTVWSIIIPHFTEKGINTFKSYFGEDFLKNLGQPFNPMEKNVILF